VDTKNYNVGIYILEELLEIKNRNHSQGFKMFFYIACCMYVLYLVLLLLRAYTELRSMPYFGEI